MKELLQKLAFRLGYQIKRNSSREDIMCFIKNFKSHYVNIELTRIGGDKDGGYLVPSHSISNINYCFSPGVAETMTFEEQLADEFGIKSYMADASVKGIPIEHNNFSFQQKFIGSVDDNNYMNLSEWVYSVDNIDNNMILQMDIEGGEYDVLTFESKELFSKFSIILIEFHGWNNLFDKHFLRMVDYTFKKLFKTHSICHVHPNNCCGITSLDGISVPNVVEVTFIRNDEIKKTKPESIQLPHNLDFRNVILRPEIIMPSIWWADT